MEYETVIGLEVHVQLLTQSKMFCSCRADYQNAPVNSRVCPVCLGLPGALPVINKKAVEFTIMTGLALGCDIPNLTKFDRKNYPYPDLMKGYQISQYDMPLAMNGHLDITADGQDRRVRVERVHLEEDVSKLQHVNGGADAHSLVDVNRSGVPLMEVVSHPDMRTPEEARAYLTSLHSIIQYLGVSTANAQDGSFRCDANISLRPVGQEAYGTKAEIKNMNSLRSVFMALNHEQERQRRILDSGERVVQETRGWSEERSVTYSQRSKEEAHDYRYFPEPDLPPLVVAGDWIEEIRSRIPELAAQRLTRFTQQYGLPEYDARLLTGSKAMADFYEKTNSLKSSGGPESGRFAKNVSNWILGDLTRLLNLKNLEINESPVSPEHLAELISLVDQDAVSVSMAKTVLEESFDSGDSPSHIIQEKGYTQISDSSAVKSAVGQAIQANPQAVADYNSGKESAAKFLVGQVMKLTKGQAKPDLVNELVVEALDAGK
ncbi:MAG: Asp-tRNA(Asn)/Glu-tRNA(Gln) amidotransferase subunit GatB [Chloroflexi bacterium]|nr:Asp-tRNA(Asn)/Glu-tRNA(Gln) amidotransferase subunit GatB [Chloroflexota bacterium]MDA1271577.1 Asp-tRNA(Asn)/Glu-tRNA(Gln) amidotransferase subunit GatB [Chloroflexota bacterium]PKB58349.1 MAG: glutaminyl-tRNA synthase (glutamine-hydrolyzing) subunit B [SAR202 cluster bacterium Casp-Chloro-G2]